MGGSTARRYLVGRAFSHWGSHTVCRRRQADLFLPAERGAVMGTLHEGIRRTSTCRRCSRSEEPCQSSEERDRHYFERDQFFKQHCG